MNYLKEVCKYYFKNLGWILFFAIIPVLFFGLILPPFRYFEFLFKYPTIEMHTFGDFWKATFTPGWWSILLFFAGFVILVVTISLLLGVIEKHFKTGKVTLSNDFSLNSNLLSVARVMILFVIAYFVINFLSMLLVFVVHCIFSAEGMAMWFNITFACAMAVVTTIFLARFATIASLTCIEMVLNGSPFMTSLSDAFSAVSRAGSKLRVFELVIFATICALVLLFTILGLPWLGEILGLVILIPFECIMGMVVFFDLNDLTRFDKKRLYFRN